MTRLVVAAAIVDAEAGKLLLAQRRYPPEVAGLWELPGGKVEPGEAPAAALAREIVEELGVRIEVGDQIGRAVELREGLSLIALSARLVAGTPVALDHQAVRWVDSPALRQMAEAGKLVPADREWLPELIAALSVDTGFRRPGPS